MAHVAVSLVRAVVDELEHQGVDPDTLLASSGIDASLLDDPTARVPVDRYDALQIAALDASGESAFGLRMGANASLGAFSTLGTMAAQCRTIRDALELVLPYYRLVADVAEPPALIDDGEVTFLDYTYLRHPDPRLDRLRAEFGLTRLLAIARMLLGDGIDPIETWFEHAPPPHADAYGPIFRGTERFGQRRTGFRISRALLDRVQRHHDEGLLGVIRAEADRSLERITGRQGIAGRVKHFLVEDTKATRLEMDAIARKLGISTRTLRRKLAAEGIGFQRLVDEAMREVACGLLRDPKRSIQDAAFELGFSDPSSFHRAFKRWTGTTPAGYRKSEPVRSLR